MMPPTAPDPRPRRTPIIVCVLACAAFSAATFLISNPGSLALPVGSTLQQWILLDATTRVPVDDPVAAQIVAGAKAQVGTLYDAAYVPISFPGGDVAPDRGACTDVVVRSLRAAGFDLQAMIHTDMQNNWAAYPKKWGLTQPDPNIDHRRVPNQMTFFSRHGKVLTTEVNAKTLQQWKPGDIVCWKSTPRGYHTGVLSDGVNANGIPLVIHNGSICREDDCLTRWPIIAHYRFPAVVADTPTST